MENYIYINQEKKAEFLKWFDKWTEDANQCLKVLKDMNIPTDLKTLKELLVTDEAFEAWVKEAEEKRITQTGFLPVEEINRIKASFNFAIESSKTARQGLKDFLFNEYGLKIIQRKDGTIHADPKELEIKASKNASKTITAEEQEYIKLLQELGSAFRKVATYETEHRFIKVTTLGTDFYRLLERGFPKEQLHQMIGCYLGKMGGLE